MFKYRYSSWILVIALILIFIIPFLYVTRFTFPAADDFCRASLDANQYFDEFNYWYTSLTGRYTNFLLVYLPVYNLEVYRILLATLFSALGISVFCFTRFLWNYFNLVRSNFIVVFISILFFITLISQLPSLYEFFYWYAAVTVYLVSIIFFLFFIVMVLKTLEGKPTPFLLFYPLIFFINGNNEMLILATNFILLVILIRNTLVPRVSHLYILGANFTGSVSALFVILAPGSSNRQAFYTEGGEVFNSIMSAILSAGMFSIKSFLELPYLLFYLGLFLFIFKRIKWEPGKTLKAFHPLKLLFVSFVTLISVFIVPYYSTGNLNVNSGRIGNFIHTIFLIFTFLNIINLANFLRYKSNFEFSFSTRSIPLIFAFYLVFILFTKNYSNLIEDLRLKNLSNYSEDIKQRIILLEETKETNPKIGRITGSLTIPHWEIKSDLNNWVNICYLKYLEEKFSLNFSSIQALPPKEDK